MNKIKTILNKKSVQKYVIPISGIAIIAAGIVLVSSHSITFGFFNNGNEYKTEEIQKNSTVEITEDGFSKTQIIIRKGGTVTFTNKSKGNTWPASDPHPTHTYYASFDVQQPIQPGESWSYTFNEAGRYGMHDHLHPSRKGKIVVLSKGSDLNNLEDYDQNCDPTDGQCFDAMVEKAVREKGVEAGYHLLEKAFDEGTLTRNCHWTAHTIGGAAYELFKQGKEFPLSEATSYCGYGFYHEFLEHLLRDNPEAIDQVVNNFCGEVKAQLGNMGLWNCYHGIGHGQTQDPPDERTWGDAEAMMKQGKDTCSTLFSDNFDHLDLCLTGVFTVIAEFAEKGEYGLSINENNPFELCKKQPYKFQKACYGEIGANVFADPDFWIADLPNYLRNIDDAKTRRLLVWTAPSITMGRDYDNTNAGEKYIKACEEHFPGEYKDICIGGSIYGMFSNSKPGEQYKNVIEFCKSNLFTEEEKQKCYTILHHRMTHASYAQDNIQTACSYIPEEYREYCSSDTYKPAYDDPEFDTPEPTTITF